jgi:hypothetical protein
VDPNDPEAIADSLANAYKHVMTTGSMRVSMDTDRNLVIEWTTERGSRTHRMTVYSNGERNTEVTPPIAPAEGV